MSYAGENNLPRCPKCHERTLERNGDDAHCWACGSDFPGAFSKYDPKPKEVNVTKGFNKAERHKYYETNKEAIIADLFSMGRKATREKWDIPVASLFTLEKRWLSQEQKEKLDKVNQESESVNRDAAIDSNQLPAFPEFCNEWDPQVQLRWLGIYEAMTITRRS